MAFTPGKDEIRLIEDCMANDRLAQRTLYEKYKNAMYTIAYRITGNYEDANEVLQDAFLRVFKAIGKFRRESSLGAWIKTIVVRVALTKVKKRLTFDSLDELEKDQSVHFHHAIDIDYLDKCIQALPDGYRSVFVLAEIEGYKHREIAELLSISEGTSKSQLFHAKKHLKKMLEKVGKTI